MSRMQKLVFLGVGIGAAYAVFLFVWASPEPTTIRRPRPRPAASAASSAPAEPTGSRAKKVPTANLQETPPPVGKDLLLSQSAVTYCLAEEIRLEGARAVLATAADQERYNSLAKDFNSRCGSYRYDKTQFNTAKRNVDNKKAVLRSEGRARFEQPEETAPASQKR
jgi:hypothetical protein